MFLLGLILLLNTHFSFALECLTNCTVGPFSFSQPFYIPYGQCLQRVSKNYCSISLKFNYKEQTYVAHFETYPITNDFIYVTSGPYLSYTIDYTCSNDASCAASYAEDLYDEMVSRNSDAARIYGQIALYIENSAREQPLRCYDLNNEIVTCLPDEMCSLEYNQNDNRIQSRGCVMSDVARIAFYDSGTFAYFDVHCEKDLCNDMLTFSQIQTIFTNNDLTDSNGRKRSNSAFRQQITFSFSFLIFLINYI